MLSLETGLCHNVLRGRQLVVQVETPTIGDQNEIAWNHARAHTAPLSLGLGLMRSSLSDDAQEKL